MIEAVDFSRRQAPQARLSAPRVPGRRSERFWQPEEDALLRAHYSSGGVNVCLEKLPGRSRSAIYARANGLTLKSNGRTGPRILRDPASIAALDARIREAWPTLSGRGALAVFAASTGEDRWRISQRAAALGLTKAHRLKEPGWTAAENELMGRIRLDDPGRAAEIFAEHGFRRSPTAIMVRAKRLGLSRRRSDVLSATAAAAILGVDIKWITTRCIEGRLAADKRQTRRLVQQGGDTWSIAHADLRAFILANLEEIDIRKVEKFAFIELIAATPEVCS